MRRGASGLAVVSNVRSWNLKKKNYFYDTVSIFEAFFFITVTRAVFQTSVY